MEHLSDNKMADGSEYKDIKTVPSSCKHKKLSICVSLLALAIALCTASFVLYIHVVHLMNNSAITDGIFILAKMERMEAKLDRYINLVKQMNDSITIDSTVAKEEKIEGVHKILSQLVLELTVGSDDSENKTRVKRGVISSDDQQAEEDLSELSLTGLSFLRGPPGFPGRDGRDGPQGATGGPGPKGESSERGAKGDDGSIGAPGLNGLNGRDGQTGRTGPRGPLGVTNASKLTKAVGVPGPRGVAGPKGDAGAIGRRGLVGQSGNRGEHGVAGPPGSSRQTGGNVYTHWGKTSCSNESTLLYSGVVASARFNTIGGGVNFQCLPPDPELTNYNAHASDVSWIRAVEYESQNYGLFDAQVDNKHAVCSRCYTGNRPAVMMIPAKLSCPTGWMKEYSGFLMASGEQEPHPSTYECVDSDPEYIGLNPQDLGGRFWFVNVDCSSGGSIGQCDKYIHARQMSCVLCSK